MRLPWRNALSAVLFVVAVIGAYLELRYTRLGLPGPHRLALTVYIIVAIYALASMFLRSAVRRR